MARTIRRTRKPAPPLYNWPTKPRHQPCTQGGRQRLSAGVLREIDTAVRHTSAKFKVSRSWVVAQILAEYFGIKGQPKW